MNVPTRAAGSSSSSNDVYIAGALAGEWAPIPNFSFGAEAQLGHYNTGQLGAAAATSGFVTATLFVARLHF